MNENPWLEERGIMNAIVYADTHWQRLITSNRMRSAVAAGEVLGGSALADGQLLLHFRRHFPSLEVGSLTEDALKGNRCTKARWHDFLSTHAAWADSRDLSKVPDWNTMTLLRADSSEGYTQDNVIIVTRLQFTCIELAREAERLNDGASERGLRDFLATHKNDLDTAVRSGDTQDKAKTLDILATLDRLPTPSFTALRESLVGMSLGRAANVGDEDVAQQANSLRSKWQGGSLLSRLVSQGRDGLSGMPEEKVRRSAAAALAILDASGRVSSSPEHLMEEERRRALASDDVGGTTNNHTHSSDTSPNQSSASYRLSITEAERLRQEMTDVTVHAGVALLREYGVCHIDTALGCEYAQELCGVAEDIAHRLHEKIVVAEGDEELAATSVFRYAECSQRCAGRLDFREGMDAAPFSDDTLIYHPLWFPMIQAMLGADAELLTAGVVVSQPLETPTALNWHTDGPHLYAETGVQLPAHCINVMVPLVDVSEEVGPTEYIPGSHTLEGAQSYRLQGNHDNVVNFCEEGMKIIAGSATLFDYRLVHRGRANCSATQRRPLLYLTYGRAWFAKQPIVDANFCASRPLIGAEERSALSALAQLHVLREAERVAKATGDFISSRAFAGDKKGYVFRRGTTGLGYYLVVPG
jgi:hypothetical protein